MRGVYWNGQIVSSDKVLIPFEDAGFLYGEGVFTTLRVKNGQPCFLKEHLARLKEQSEMLSLPQPKIDHRVIFDLIALNQALQGDFRLKLIRTPGQEIAFVAPYQAREGEPCTLRLEPIPHYQSSAPIKSLAYLDRKWARAKAQQEGFDDSLLCCPGGFWLETGSGNVFWHEKGKFYYPSQTNFYLKGIILTRLIESKQMVPAVSNPSREANLYLCNSLHGVRPVVQVQGFPYPRDFDMEKEWPFLVK